MSTTAHRPQGLSEHEMLVAEVAARVAIYRLSQVQPIPRRFLNSKEAASWLGLASADVLAVWRAQGRAPPHVGTGKMIRYDINVLEEWMASRPTSRTLGSGVGDVGR
jgi:hypothetical protein